MLTSTITSSVGVLSCFKCLNFHPKSPFVWWNNFFSLLLRFFQLLDIYTKRQGKGRWVISNEWKWFSLFYYASASVKFVELFETKQTPNAVEKSCDSRYIFFFSLAPWCLLSLSAQTQMTNGEFLSFSFNFAENLKNSQSRKPTTSKSCV